jgi:small subunit ribosomal protein S5
MAQMMEESTGLTDHTIGIYRTAATVKGGRRFSFGALVVVGDGNGRVGYGYGKANEVPNAIEKAQKAAKRALITVPRIGTTINHEVEGRFMSSKVRLLPASPGTGVIAGGVVRSILEKAGVADCLSKCYGSTNARNVVKAVFDGLEQLRTPDTIAQLRGVELGTTDIEDRIERGKAFMPIAGEGSEKAKAPVNTVGQDRKGRGGGGRRGGGGGGRSRRPSGPPVPAPAPAAAPADAAKPAEADTGAADSAAASEPSKS